MLVTLNKLKAVATFPKVLNNPLWYGFLKNCCEAIRGILLQPPQLQGSEYRGNANKPSERSDLRFKGLLGLGEVGGRKIDLRGSTGLVRGCRGQSFLFCFLGRSNWSKSFRTVVGDIPSSLAI